MELIRACYWVAQRRRRAKEGSMSPTTEAQLTLLQVPHTPHFPPALIPDKALAIVQPMTCMSPP